MGHRLVLSILADQLHETPFDALKRTSNLLYPSQELHYLDVTASYKPAGARECANRVDSRYSKSSSSESVSMISP